MGKRGAAAIGGRFARTSTPQHVYAVVALADKPGHPLHIRLQAVDSVPDDEVLVTAALH